MNKETELWDEELSDREAEALVGGVLESVLDPLLGLLGESEEEDEVSAKSGRRSRILPYG